MEVRILLGAQFRGLNSNVISDACRLWVTSLTCGFARHSHDRSPYTPQTAAAPASVPVLGRHGRLRARPAARIGSIRTMMRQLAHGWVWDSSSLRAWVVWVRV